MEHEHHCIPKLLVCTAYEEDDIDKEAKQFKRRKCTKYVDYFEGGLLVTKPKIKEFMQLLILE